MLFWFQDDEEEKAHCPFLLNKLCGAPRETALLASVRGGYTGVVKLLLENGADPNTYSKPVDDQSIIELSNSPIAEASRQKFYEIIEILLEWETLSGTGIWFCFLNENILLLEMVQATHQILHFQ